MVTLRNIDILGRIHIDEISARVTGRQNRGAAEAEITIDGLRFKNVIVDGRQIIVRPDAARLNRMRTFAGSRGREERRAGAVDERDYERRSDAGGSRHRNVVFRQGAGQAGRAERDHDSDRVRAATFDAASRRRDARRERY